MEVGMPMALSLLREKENKATDYRLHQRSKYRLARASCSSALLTNRTDE